MDDPTCLAERFAVERARLWRVAHRILGSAADADDAVQEAWLRLSRSGDDGVEDLAAWLTTVTTRICLNALRSRARRAHDDVEGHLPTLVVSALDEDPEEHALTADSVGLALLVVLERQCEHVVEDERDPLHR
jgi:RNA polymerase sigma factor (sigma-70 family)